MPRRSSIVSVHLCRTGARRRSVLVGRANRLGSHGIQHARQRGPELGRRGNGTSVNCPMTPRAGVGQCMSHTVTDAHGKILRGGDAARAMARRISALGLRTPHPRRRRDDRARRCAGRSNRRGGSRRLPIAIRTPRLHDGQWLFRKGQSERSAGVVSVRRQRLGDRDGARPRHGQRGMSELQDRPRRGEQRRYVGPRGGGERGRRPRRHGHQQQLRRGGGLDHGVGVVGLLRPPGRPHHGERRRRWVRRELPGDVAVRHGRRGNDALSKSSRLVARLDRDGVDQLGGSGCSAYVAKPSYQKDTGCSFRTEADVSAVADPNTGLAVYDSYDGTGGWIVVGGTSASSPLVAAIFAVTGEGPRRDASVPILQSLALLRRDQRLERKL